MQGKPGHCSSHKELQMSSLSRTKAPTVVPHAGNPNGLVLVGMDFVQVELKRTHASGKIEEKVFNVLTCVDLATSFAQQVIVQPDSVNRPKK